MPCLWASTQGQSYPLLENPDPKQIPDFLQSLSSPSNTVLSQEDLYHAVGRMKPREYNDTTRDDYVSVEK